MKLLPIALAATFLLLNQVYADNRAHEPVAHATVATVASSDVTSRTPRTVKYESEEENPARYIDLSMEPVVSGKTDYNISIDSVNNFGGNNMCDISGSFHLQQSNGHPTFTLNAADPANGIEGPCLITITFDNERYLRATITQDGADYQCGCGASAGVDGRIKVSHKK